MLLMGAMLAACATEPVQETGSSLSPWDRARLRGVDFRAIGQEPGWLVDIEDGERITVLTDYGQSRTIVPAPAPETDGQARTTYFVATGTHTLTVVLEDAPCQDVMSGEAFPVTVTMELDGQAYRGCGRYLS
ncbi:MAG TPA: hypothetical protein VFO41_06005 [Alphaproteobacteria bacterium]|nr:hypothetical protein [Alphaproteobacteria bacterium]